jgi:4-hydroxybenzoate polyprenyltransferase
MGEVAARDVTLRRSRPRAYLLLARFSNLPTIWSNVLAGTIVSGAAFAKGEVTRVAIAVSLLYTAGMFLNDAFDRDIDVRARPDRPIPAGDVTAREAFVAGWTLLAAGLLVTSLANAAATVWAVVLAAAIVFYDYRHKQNPFGPVVMGACRGLVYCVAAASVGSITSVVIAAAAVLTVYVIGLTWVAKHAGPRAGWLVPLLIATISILDAAVIFVSGGGLLAGVALVGFPATLWLQRVVPGT